MVYLDTSILLVYTLTSHIETERFKAVSTLLGKTNTGILSQKRPFDTPEEIEIICRPQVDMTAPNQIFLPQI